MSDQKNKVPRPGENTGAKKRETPSVKAFQQSDYDVIYPEGETIDVDTEIQAGYIVRQGSVAVEMIITAPGGLMTIGLDTVEAGEYFNIHSLFGFKLEDSASLRYRAQCRTVIMPVTEDMLPQDLQKLSAILRSFMQTSARREGKLRQLTGYALQRAEEKRVDRGGGNSQLLTKYRQELEKRVQRIASLEQELVETKNTSTQMQELGIRLTELENANAAIRRDKLQLSENLKNTEDELRSLRNKLALEERTRKALEKRNADLTKQLAVQNYATSSARFPSANILLESNELSNFESGAKQFRKAAAHFESLAIMMQRAMELIAEDNPGIVISEDVMMLMTGQEPPARPSVENARAQRDSADFKTIHLGSDSPEVAAAKAGVRAEKSHKQTDRNILPRKPQNFSDDAPPSASDSQSIRSESSLSEIDVQAILEEFVSDDDPPKIPRVSELPQSSGVNVPYPKFGNQWDAEPDTGRPTRPFVPDGDFQATNSDIDIPPNLPTPHLSEPSRMQTPIDGARRATKISGRYLQPIDKQTECSTDREIDSDITPVVPEYPRQNTSQNSRVQSWDDDTFSARPEEIPTRKEGSGPRHPAINFPDESTDVRQIQEDWRSRLQQSGKPNNSDEAIPLSSQNIPAPPANLFSEIEPVQKAPTSFRDWEDVEEADPSELNATGDQDELIQVTEVYSSPGEAFYNPQPPAPDEVNKQSTIAYDFPAPGKPPKPKS